MDVVHTAERPPCAAKVRAKPASPTMTPMIGRMHSTKPQAIPIR